MGLSLASPNARKSLLRPRSLPLSLRWGDEFGSLSVANKAREHMFGPGTVLSACLVHAYLTSSIVKADSQMVRKHLFCLHRSSAIPFYQVWQLLSWRRVKVCWNFHCFETCRNRMCTSFARYFEKKVEGFTDGFEFLWTLLWYSSSDILFCKHICF